MNLTKPQREQVRLRYGGRCSYCGTALDGKWHADHLLAIERTGVWRKTGHRYQYQQTGIARPEHDILENLVPACVPCNIDKSDMKLESWRARLTALTDVLERNYSAFRHAQRFERVEVNAAPLVFWYETYTKLRRRT